MPSNSRLGFKDRGSDRLREWERAGFAFLSRSLQAPGEVCIGDFLHRPAPGQR